MPMRRRLIRFLQGHGSGPEDPVRLVQEYVRTLKSGGLWNSRRAKVIRFIVLQTVGASLGLITGGGSIILSLGISAADSYLVEKIRLGFQPRYFIDDLRHRLFSG